MRAVSPKPTPPTGGGDKDQPVAGLASRLAAFGAVRRVHDTGAWSTVAVAQALRDTDLDARDRAFAANLAYETLRWEGTLDWALGQVVDRSLSDVEPDVLDVLRLGAWQLLHGNVPDRSAVDTAVEVARSGVGPRATGFVNGVLRALSRKRARLPWPDPDGDGGLALATGYPPWIVTEARERFGERCRVVLEAGNQAPGLTLRVLRDRPEVVAELEAQGLNPSPGRHAPEALRAPGADPGRLSAVTHGRAVPQDEASMIVSRMLMDGIETAEPLVADVCAGPGGKTTHLAQLGARVVAADLRPHRARLVAAAVARCDLAARVVGVVAADACAPPLREGGFDAALVDAPCTGLGVVRRRPELRWRRAADDPARLGELQLGLLEGAAGLVRPGGRLLYSACTWTKAETVDVTAGFLAIWGDRFTLAVDVQLDPARDDTDGMYVACLNHTG